MTKLEILQYSQMQSAFIFIGIIAAFAIVFFVLLLFAKGFHPVKKKGKLSVTKASRDNQDLLNQR